MSVILSKQIILPVIPPPDYLCFTANTAGSTIGMSLTGTPTRTVSFEYSIDRNNWNTLFLQAEIL